MSRLHLFSKTPCIKDWTWTCSIVFCIIHDVFRVILQARAREAATAAITKLNLKRLKALMVGTLASAMLMFLEWCVFASEILPNNLPVWDKKSTQGCYRIHGHIDTSINPPSNCPLAVPNCTVNCSIGLFRKLTSGCITHLHVYPSLLASFACKSYNSAILVFVTLFQVVSFWGRFYSGFAGESNLAQHNFKNNQLRCQSPLFKLTCRDLPEW